MHFSEREGLYFAQSDTSGLFHLSHLSAGSYRLFAFSDKNKNRHWDRSDEGIAFLADTLHLSSKKTLNVVSLLMVEQNYKSLSLISAGPRDGHYVLDYNKSLSDYEVYVPGAGKDTLRSNILDSLQAGATEGLHSSLSVDGKRLIFYKNVLFEHANDSLEVHVSGVDEVGNMRKDTLFVRFSADSFEETSDSTTLTLKTFTPALNSDQKAEYFEDTLQISLTFDVPVASVAPDSIYLLVSDSLEQVIPLEARKWDNHFMTYALTLEATGLGEAFDLVAGAEAFVDAEGRASSAYKQHFKRINLNERGSISGHIQAAEDHIILEVLNKSNEISARTVHKKSFDVKGLMPGDYRFGLIMDRNGDGRWDRGHIFLNTQPEAIYMPDTLLSIRQNWIIEHMDIVLPSIEKRLESIADLFENHYPTIMNRMKKNKKTEE